jgi:hypothetical protein
MTLSDIASVASVVSGLAVLGSLIYLGLQTRQDTKHSRALIQQGRAARTAETLIRWGEVEWSDDMDACLAGATEVSAKDMRRFLLLARAIFVSYEDSYLQHQQGLLIGAAFDHFDASTRAVLESRGARMAWRVNRRFFASGFKAYMDHIVGEAAAKPTVSDMARWLAAASEETAMPATPA